MHKLLLSALLATVAVPAFAADMPVKAPYREPPEVYNWTGLYIGGHVGGGWSKFKGIDPDLLADQFFTGDAFSSPKPRGIVGGFHAGYNWQVAPVIVLGIEGDFSFSGMKQTQTLNVPGGPTVLSPTVGGLACVNCDLQDGLRAKIDNLASVRGRLGFLITPNLMFYGTGGAAWAEAKIDVSGSATFTQAALPASLRGTQFASLTASGDKTFSGWVIGGGGEYMLTRNILLRVEYLHYDFGSKTVGLSGELHRGAFPPFAAFTAPLSADVKTGLTTDVIRGGVSYKF